MLTSGQGNSPARQVKSNTHFSRYTDLEPTSEIFYNLGHYIFLSNLSILLRKLGNLLLLCLKSRLYLPIYRIAANDQKLPMRMRVHEITLQIRNFLLSKNVPNLERILLIDVIMFILKIERGKPCFILAITLQIRNVLLKRSVLLI